MKVEWRSRMNNASPDAAHQTVLGLRLEPHAVIDQDVVQCGQQEMKK